MEVNKRKWWVIGLTVIAVIILGMWMFSPTEVSVTGIGKVSVPATSATFNVTVSTVNESASTALAEIRNKVNMIKKSLTEINIGSESITETQVTITPAAAIATGAQGYQAMLTMTVKTANVPMVADIVVNMYASGAAVVSQPVVMVEDQDKLEQEALRAALKEAKKSLRETVGLRPIKKIVAIQQASSGNAATATKVVGDNQGEFEVVKAVSVTYRVW